jgi:hypothetical protein
MVIVSLTHLPACRSAARLCNGHADGTLHSRSQVANSASGNCPDVNWTIRPIAPGADTASLVPFTLRNSPQLAHAARLLPSLKGWLLARP